MIAKPGQPATGQQANLQTFTVIRNDPGSSKGALRATFSAGNLPD